MGIKPKFGNWILPRSRPKPKSKYHKKSKLVNKKGRWKSTRCPPQQQIKLSSLKRYLKRNGLTKISKMSPLIVGRG